MVTFDLSVVQVLALLVGTVSPLLVGLVTTRVVSAGKKAVSLLALTSVTGLGAELLDALRADESYNVGAGLMLALTAFITGVAMHFGIWKPLGASQKAQEVGSKPAA